MVELRLVLPGLDVAGEKTRVGDCPPPSVDGVAGPGRLGERYLCDMSTSMPRRVPSSSVVV